MSSSGMEDMMVSMGAQTSLHTPQSSLLSGISDGITLNPKRRLERQHCQLLPGISDDITLNQITPKLSWRDFYILSSVSRGWCHAIQTRQVYDARVRQRSTEELVLIDHTTVTLSGEMNDTRDQQECITMFDTRDYFFHQLLPPPGFDDRGGCVTLDGKVYVLLSKGDVYMMDLAGQRKWTRCASRTKPKQKNLKKKCDLKNKCGVIHRKIYVFHDSPHDGLDVFDVASNSWSVIKPAVMNPPGEFSAIFVKTVGEELYIFGGGKTSHILQVYNPAKDEWRKRDSPDLSASFCRQGKFHAFVRHSRHGFSVETFDAEKNSWKTFRSCSFEELSPPFSSKLQVLAALNVDDDEVLAIVSWLPVSHYYEKRYGLLRGVHFASHCTEILWQKVEVFPSRIRPIGNPGCSMSSIEL